MFKICPGDIYIFDDETPEWTYPMYNDNVAIVHVSDPTFESLLDVGNYSKRFHIYDYEDNVAICMFQIIVSSRGMYSMITIHLGRPYRLQYIFLYCSFDFPLYM